MAFGGALPASTAASAAGYELVEVAPGSVYSVVGPLLEAGGVVYFQGTSPSSPGGSWLFAFDPATGAVGPVGTTSSLGQVSGLRTDGAMLYFLSPAGGRNAIHVYDPVADAVAQYDWPADDAFPDELAILGADVYVVMQGDGLLHSVPRADPASAPGIAPTATTPLPKCADGTTDPASAAGDLHSAGGYVYYVQSCADILSDQLFRRAGPSAAEAVAFPASPPAATYAAAYGVLEHGGRTYFAAGAISGTQHLYSFVSGDLAQPTSDLGGLNPGRPTVFRGAVTWFMQDGAERRLYRSDDGLTATPIGTSAGTDLEGELGLAAWGDVLLFNGFPVVSPSDPIGTRTNYLYDAADAAIARIGPAGAIVPPFVTSTGDAYVTAFAALGADADSQHLYRLVRHVLPDTGFDPAGAAIAAAFLVLGAGLVWTARRRPRLTPRG
ncbi:MAG: hypothetical protein BGO95_09055 [Micrococcales bacterium 73-13]|nr:MAG: hypothetical protein BGO95_09055 [Micrococcales bacterium 73-13]